MVKPIFVNKTGHRSPRIDQNLVDRIIAAKEIKNSQQSKSSSNILARGTDSDAMKNFNFEKFKEQIQEIRTSLSIVRSNHRKALDQEIVRCYSVADQLRRAIYRQRGLIGLEMKEICQKIADEEEYALEYVLHQAFSDNKQASFYSRSLKRLFRDKVPWKSLLDVVSQNGGYQKLADQQAKKRQLDPNRPATGASGAGGGTQASDGNTTPRGANIGVASIEDQPRSARNVASRAQKPIQTDGVQCSFRLTENTKQLININDASVIWLYAEVRPVPGKHPDIVITDLNVMDALD